MIYKHVPISFGVLFLVTGFMGCFFLAFNSSILLYWELLSISSYNISLPILLDPTSLIFMSLVSFISANVLIFGNEYMKGEHRLGRFWLILVGFVLSMFLVVLTPNLLTMMMGWDGLGMSSFLLIIHYQDQLSLWGGLLTILVNRVGDSFLILAAVFWFNQGTSNIFLLTSYGGGAGITHQMLAPEYLTISLLCMAGYSKSANIPFNLWLPEAMAAPTPVSTLVHSSTLVTAGVYLLIRSYNIWSAWPLASLSVSATGFATMMAGGAMATTEADLKKTIAYSTMSQVGIMVMILGLGFPTLSFMHLITHALFKATMFMCAGSVFMYSHHYQTFDNYHSKWYMPLTGIGLVVSILAMNVFPFFAGMYSKEVIVLRTMEGFLFSSLHGYSILGVCIFLAASGLTTIYSVRIWRGLWMTKYFARTYMTLEKVALRPDQYANSNPKLSLPLSAMILGSATGGSLMAWFILSPNDIPLMHIFIKFVAMSAVVGGIFGAFYPCRGTTKARHNKSVVKASLKKTSPGLNSMTAVFKCRNTKGKVLVSLWASITSEWSHINNSSPIFMERVIYPVHRLGYSSSKMFLILDSGIMETWSYLLPSNMFIKMVGMIERWHPSSLLFLMGPPIVVITFIEVMFMKT